MPLGNSYVWKVCGQAGQIYRKGKGGGERSPLRKTRQGFCFRTIVSQPCIEPDLCPGS